MGLDAVVSSDADCDDDELILRIRQGEDREHLYEELTGRYRQRLQFFLYGSLRDRELAEDMVQETFLRVYEHIDDFDTKGKFSKWIYTIARNLALTQKRNWSRKPTITFTELSEQRKFFTDADHDSVEPRSSFDPEKDLQRAEIRRAIDVAVRELAPPYRNAYVAREMDGKTYMEISDLLGVPLGTVKTLIYRARQALAAKVSKNL